MTALQQLDAYIQQVDRRLKTFGAARGSAIGVGSALILTVVLSWLGNRMRFAEGVVWPLRLCLFGGIACAFVFGLIRPLLKLNRRNTVRVAESRVSEFGERLVTLSERRDETNPFHELIAEDAVRVAQMHPANDYVPAAGLVGAIAAAIAMAICLIWLITAAPGYLGYGASLLWTNSGRTTMPLYDIAVQPGNATVRRRADQAISAELRGFSAANVTLHAKYHDASKWEQIPMQAQNSSNAYQILFSGVSDSLEYFVEAGGSQSKHFTLTVKDLPVVKRLRVVVHAPKALGIPDDVEDPGGDIRAVEGSSAEVSVLTDKPLDKGMLMLEDGSRIPLAMSTDNWLTASIPIKSDGAYHVAALDKQDVVRLSDNYILEARKDEAPMVKIMKPGRDTGVSPIEEMPIAVSSSDDFGLHGVDLHFSVNGGPEQVKSLAANNNAKNVDGKTVLELEKFKLAPGDLVTYYATAKDATHLSRSDIAFAKVEPFDLKFQQAQSAGGNGDGAGEQNDKISERQKQIIAATWNQLKDPAKDNAALAQNAHFLSELEGKLGEQAKSLPERMGNRDVGEGSEQFKEFAKSMEQASGQMSEAVTQLQSGKWNSALAPEQKGLQALLHAESLFRDIQVSMNRGSSGGSGGSASGQESELARLFDLELDMAKNQYENAQSGSSKGQGDSQKEQNAELERLKELARRQQQLAEQNHSQQQQFQQRWEEEQLRREAEQLREQLKQEQQQQGSGAQSASAQSVALQKAMDGISKAENDMRNAASNGDPGAQQRAANQLSQAQNALQDMARQQANNDVNNLAKEARDLASKQEDLARQIKKQYGAEGINMARSDENGNPVMPEMNGPDFAGGFRRRQQLAPAPNAPATNEEKKLAEENDKLAEQIQKLQDKMHDTAQAIAPQQPGTAKKLQKALSDAEQEEIAVRMRKGSDWMRQGAGSKTWPIEDSISAATQQLSKQTEEARRESEKPQTPADGKQGDGTLNETLAEVQAMREQLQQGQAGNQGGGLPQQGGGLAEQLSQMRARLGRGDRQVYSAFSDAVGALQRLNAQPGLLDARVGNANQTLERLEMELTRRIAQKAGARTIAPENVPEAYREAVASYYRSLSK